MIESLTRYFIYYYGQCSFSKSFHKRLILLGTRLVSCLPYWVSDSKYCGRFVSSKWNDSSFCYKIVLLQFALGSNTGLVFSDWPARCFSPENGRASEFVLTVSCGELTVMAVSKVPTKIKCYTVMYLVASIRPSVCLPMDALSVEET